MVNRDKQERMNISARDNVDCVDSAAHTLDAAKHEEDWIGQQLRQVYDATLNEPIPDRFLELLKQIDRKDPKST